MDTSETFACAKSVRFAGAFGSPCVLCECSACDWSFCRLNVLWTRVAGSIRRARQRPRVVAKACLVRWIVSCRVTDGAEGGEVLLTESSCDSVVSVTTRTTSADISSGQWTDHVAHDWSHLVRSSTSGAGPCPSERFMCSWGQNWHNLLRFWHTSQLWDVVRHSCYAFSCTWSPGSNIFLVSVCFTVCCEYVI